MKNYIAFLKKEWMEYLRTYKVFVAVVVFSLLGLMNPLIAKFTPEIIQMFAEEFAAAVPWPVRMDAWIQFFGNMTSIGLIVLVVLFSGMMSGELQKGSLILLLTKGMPRTTVMLAKLTMAILLWSVSYLICFGVTYGYTAYFFEKQEILHLGQAAAGMWLFGILLIAVTMYGSVLSVHGYAGLLFTGGTVCVLFLLNIVPILQEFNPLRLCSGGSLISGELQPADFYPALIVTLVLIAVSVVLAGAVFYKKKI